jgi:hypothetical protein
MKRNGINVGDTVIVSGGGRRAVPERGTVVKIGRVWVNVNREGQQWGWRFRLDTQHDGGNGYGTRFWTLEQWAQAQLNAAAESFLREQDVSIGYRSPWRERAVELATLMGWTPPVAEPVED